MACSCAESLRCPARFVSHGCRYSVRNSHCLDWNKRDTVFQVLKRFQYISFLDGTYVNIYSILQYHVYQDGQKYICITKWELSCSNELEPTHPKNTPTNCSSLSDDFNLTFAVALNSGRKIPSNLTFAFLRRLWLEIGGKIHLDLWFPSFLLCFNIILFLGVPSNCPSKRYFFNF